MKTLSITPDGVKSWIEIEESNDDPIVATERDQLRRKYLDLTAALCQLAGMTYSGKLSNIEYDEALQRAATHTPAGVIAASLVYCRTRLYELDGDSWWDNIGGMI